MKQSTTINFRKRFITFLLMLSMLVTYMPSLAFADIDGQQGESKVTPIVVATAKASGKKAVRLTWLKTEGAHHYAVFGCKCGAGIQERVIKKKLTSTNYKVSKISGKKLKAHSNYRFSVVAYNAENNKIAESLALYVITTNTKGKFANATMVKFSNNSKNASITLDVKDSPKQLSPKMIVYKDKKPYSNSHVKKYRYISSNKQVATVSNSGKITAKASGNATIYVQAANGVYCKVYVTVTDNDKEKEDEKKDEKDESEPQGGGSGGGNSDSIKTYKVEFDMQNHGTPISPQDVVPGGRIATPEDPSEYDYVFMGWFKEPDCKTEWNFYTDTVNKHETLYACWKTKLDAARMDAIDFIKGVVGDNPTPALTSILEKYTNLINKAHTENEIRELRGQAIQEIMELKSQENNSIGGQKEIAISAIESAAGPESGRSKDLEILVGKAELAIERAGTTEEINRALSDYLAQIADMRSQEAGMAAARTSAVEAIQQAAGDPETRSDEMKDIVSDGMEKIKGATTVDQLKTIVRELLDRIKAQLAAEQLADEKKKAIETIEELAGEDPSPEMQGIVDNAKSEVSAASKPEEVQDKLKDAISEIEAQKEKSEESLYNARQIAKRAIEAAAGNPETRSDKMNELVASAESNISSDAIKTVDQLNAELNKHLKLIAAQLEKEANEELWKTIQSAIEAIEVAAGDKETRSTKMNNEVTQAITAIKGANTKDKAISELKRHLGLIALQLEADELQRARDNAYATLETVADGISSDASATQTIREDLERVLGLADTELQSDEYIEDINDTLEKYLADLEQIRADLDQNKLDDAIKEAKKIIDSAIGTCSSEAVKKLSADAYNALDNCKDIDDVHDKTNEYIEKIIEQIANEANLDTAKENAKQALEKAASEPRSDEMQKLVSEGAQRIASSDSQEEVLDNLDYYLEKITQLKDKEELEIAKENAKATIDKLAGENPSEDVQEKVELADSAIDNANNSEEVQKALERYIEEINKLKSEEDKSLESEKQNAKDTIDAAAGENPSTAVQAIVEQAKKDIDNSETSKDIQDNLNKAVEDILNQKATEEAGLDTVKKRAIETLETAAGGNPSQAVLDLLDDAKEDINADRTVDEVMDDVNHYLTEIANQRKADEQDKLDEASAEASEERDDLAAEKLKAIETLKAAAGDDPTPVIAGIVYTYSEGINEATASATVQEKLHEGLGAIFNERNNSSHQDADSLQAAIDSAIAAINAAAEPNPSEAMQDLVNRATRFIQDQTSPDSVLKYLNEYLTKIQQLHDKENLEFQKELVKTSIDNLAGPEETRTSAMDELVEEAYDAIKNAETMPELNDILNEYASKITEQKEKDKELENAKNDAKSTIDTVAGENPTGAIQTIVEETKEAIDKANSVDEVNQTKDAGIQRIIEQQIEQARGDLSLAKEIAKKAITEEVGDDTSDEMVELKKEACEAIDESDTKETLEDNFEYYIDKIRQLKEQEAEYKEQLSDAQDAAIEAIKEKAGNPDDWTAEMEDIIDDAIEKIVESQDINEVNNIKEETFTKIDDQYNRETIDVIFDMNGHGDQIPTQQIEKCVGYVDKPEEPRAYGYTFDGWYTTPSCLSSSIFTFENKVVKDTTLYAKWIASSYTIHFDRNGGDTEDVSGNALPNMDNQTVPYGVVTRLNLNQYTKNGWEFAGWSTSSADGAKIEYVDGAMILDLCTDGSGDVTLYAQWTQGEEVLIVYNSNNQVYGSVDPTSEYVARDGSANGSTASANPGYEFVNWVDNEDKIVSNVPHFIPQKEENGLYRAAEYTAIFRPKTYKIIFNKNEDDKPENSQTTDEQVFTYGKYEKLKPASLLGNEGNRMNQRENYTFNGWLYTPEDGSYTQHFHDEEGILNLITSGEAVFKADWGYNKFKVTFDSMGHGSTPETMEAYSGEVLSSEPQVTADGYRFDGWFKDPDFKVQWYFSDTTNRPALQAVDKVKKDITLYAKWVAVDYIVKFDANTAGFPTSTLNMDITGNARKAGNNAMYMTYDKIETLPKWSGSIDGARHFIGWKVGIQGDSNGVTEYADQAAVLNLIPSPNVTGAPSEITLYAQFISDGATIIKYTTNLKGKVDPSSEFVPDMNDESAQGSTPTAFEGYTFDRWVRVGGEDPVNVDWVDDSNKLTPKFYSGESAYKDNLEYQAIFKGVEYFIEYHANFEGADEATADYAPYRQTMSFDAPATLSENAFHRNGWTFIGWARASEDSAPVAYKDKESVINLATKTAEVVHLYAKWSQNKVTVNFDVQDHGKSVPSQTINQNEHVNSAEPMAATATGYTLDGWYIEPTGGEKWTFTNSANEAVSKDMTLYAHWLPNKYKVTFNPNGADGPLSSDGIIEKMDDQIFTYDKLQALKKNTYYRAGYSFGGWICVSADGDETLIGDQQRVINLCTGGDPTKAESTWPTVELKPYWVDEEDVTIFYQTSDFSKAYVEPQVEEIGRTEDAEGTKITFKELGYKCDYWYDKNDVVVASADTADVCDTFKPSKHFDGQVSENASNVYTAHITGIDYTIQFDKNGGKGDAMGGVAMVYGEASALPKCTYTASDDGKVFAGWNTKADGTGTAFADQQLVDKLTTTDHDTVTLYAQWHYPTGGRIAYVHDNFDGARWKFYDITGNAITGEQNKENLANAMYYEVEGKPIEDKFYVVATVSGDPEKDVIVTPNIQWGGKFAFDYYDNIGQGKINSNNTFSSGYWNEVYDTPDSAPKGNGNIWIELKKMRDNSANGYSDWFIGTTEEIKAVSEFLSEKLSTNQKEIWTSSLAGDAQTAYYFDCDVKTSYDYYRTGSNEKNIVSVFMRTLSNVAVENKCTIKYKIVYGYSSSMTYTQMVTKGVPTALLPNRFEMLYLGDYSDELDRNPSDRDKYSCKGRTFAGWKSPDNTYYADGAAITVNEDIVLTAVVHRPIGGRIFYKDSVDNPAKYWFYDNTGKQINPSVYQNVTGDAVADALKDAMFYEILNDDYSAFVENAPAEYYAVATRSGKPDSAILCSNNIEWGAPGIETGLSLSAESSSKELTERAIADDKYKSQTSLSVNGQDTLWTWIKNNRDKVLNNCNDWFVPTSKEFDDRKLANLLPDDAKYWAAEENSDNWELSNNYSKNAGSPAKGTANRTNGDTGKALAVHTLSADKSTSPYIAHLNYWANGGTGAMSYQELFLGRKQTIRDNEFKAPNGKVFIGWNTERDGSGIYLYPGQSISFEDSDKLMSYFYTGEDHALYLKVMKAIKNGKLFDLYAQWGEETCHIEFDMNGVKDYQQAIDDIDVGKGCRLSEPEKPQAIGYTFGGWCTDPECTTDWHFAEFVTKDMTLFAKWTPNTYTIKYEEGSGDAIAGKQTSQTAKYNEAITLLGGDIFKAPAGKKFVGWKSDKGDTFYNGKESAMNVFPAPTSTKASESVVTLTAQYEDDAKTIITFINDDASMGSVNKSYVNATDLLTAGATKTDYVDAAKATAKIPGYIFDKWTMSNGQEISSSDAIFSSSDGVLKIKVNDETGIIEPITYVAHFKPITYTIVLNGDGGKTPKGEDKIYKKDVAYNEYVDLTNPFVLKDCIFSGWAVGEDVASSSYENTQRVRNLSASQDAVVTLWAKWVFAEYTISFDLQGGTSKTKSITTSDGFIDLPSDAKRNGYTFKCWSRDSEGSWINCWSAGDPYTLKGDALLYAIWEPNKYTINYYKAGAGDDIVATADAAYDEATTLRDGTGVTVPGGKKFVGWQLVSYKTGSTITPFGADKQTIYPSKSTAVNLHPNPKTTTASNSNVYLRPVFENSATTIITYMTNDPEMGTVDPAYTVAIDGQVQGATPTPTDNTKYIFDKWTLSSGKAVTYYAEVNTTTHVLTPKKQTDGTYAPLTYVAHFKYKEKNLKFHDETGNLKSGAGLPVDTTFSYQDGVTLQDVPADKELATNGKVFVGWNTKADGTGEFYADNATINDFENKNYDLYAQWHYATGGRIFYVDPKAEDKDGITFYNENGKVTSNVADAMYYEAARILGIEKYYVYRTTDGRPDSAPAYISSSKWDTSATNRADAGYNSIGEGKNNTNVMKNVTSGTIWGSLSTINSSSNKTDNFGYKKWFIGSKDEVQALADSGIRTDFATWTSTYTPTYKASYLTGNSMGSQSSTTSYQALPIRTLNYETGNTATVTYRANGGKGEMRVQVANLGSGTAKIMGSEFEPESDIKEFVSWNTKANGNGTNYNPGTSLNGIISSGNNLILYAKWQTKQVKVTIKHMKETEKTGEYELHDITTTSYPADQSISFDASVGQGDFLNNKVSITGYKLSTSNKNQQTVAVTLDGNTTISLYYDRKTIEYIFDRGSGIANNFSQYLTTQTGKYGQAVDTAGLYSLDAGGNRNEGWIYEYTPAGATSTVQRTVNNGALIELPDVKDGTQLVIRPSFPNNECTITFVDYHQGKVLKILTKTKGQSINTAEIPSFDTPTGYETEDVKGSWYTAYGAWDDQAKWIFGTGSSATKVTKDTVLYIRWIPLTYTIHFNKGSNGSGTQMADIEAAFDDVVFLTKNTYTRNGYKFLGWTTSSTGTNVNYVDQAAVKNLTNNPDLVPTVNLFPVWEENPKVYVFFTVNDSSMGTVSPTMQMLGPDTGTGSGAAGTATATAKTGYKFVGWRKDGVTATAADGVSGNNLTPKKENGLFVGHVYEAVFAQQ